MHRGLSSIGGNRGFGGSVVPLEVPQPLVERMPSDTSVGETRHLPTSGLGAPTSTAGFLLGMLAAVQHAINERTARAYNLQIVDCVELIDVSGAAVLKSGGMQRLLKRIEGPEIHGVIVREFSRVMRPDAFADYVLLQTFQDTGTVLYLPDGPIDFGNKTGRFLGTIRAAISGLERSELLERVWGAKEQKRRAGKHPGNQQTLPFAVAYDPKSGTWHYKPEAEKVREAARLFLSGETSYKDVGDRLGIKPFNLRNALRNPIYTGWRVIDKRRDPSSKAIRTRDDGTQGDRPKIARSPEDVIRVKVLDPIISETDFAALQRILNEKKQNHWRARPDHHRRFVYGGFLRCGLCGNLIYTHSHSPRSWYICKSRTAEARKERHESGLPDCQNVYMRRERLEECLDVLISDRLRDRVFLTQIATAYTSRSSKGAQPELARVETGLAEMREKKQRVMDAYFENLIDRSERDQRLAALESDSALYGNLATRAVSSPPKLTAKGLAHVFRVFREWEFLNSGDKRKLLRAAMPEIHVADYRVTGLSLIPGQARRDDVSRTGRDSSPPRA
jgi:site-specific DNA recombinase